MPNEIDQSLLDRLQALRGSSGQIEASTPATVHVDTIERARTPTREDALASRLKSLRGKDQAPTSTARPRAPDTISAPTAGTSVSLGLRLGSQGPQVGKKQPFVQDEPLAALSADDLDDSVFQTNDSTLEQLLHGIDTEDPLALQRSSIPASTAAPAPPESIEPNDEQVKALLEELSRSVPKGGTIRSHGADQDEAGADQCSDDDSEGRRMADEADEVIARLKDETELHVAPEHGRDSESPRGDDGEPDDARDARSNEETSFDGAPDLNITFPDVPWDTSQEPLGQPSSPAPSTDVDTITARLAALRAGSSDPASLPSVPTSKPSKPVNRLTSRTNYADEDIDSWCIVCLEDATLQCRGCDDDPYCVRCWREMHVGPAAGFDERTHKAVQFSRGRRKGESKTVALGA